MGITGEPGVYWLGVHALGTSAAGRDLVADGRARSFIPLVTGPQTDAASDVSLVLPMRERARRAADGSLNGPDPVGRAHRHRRAARPGWPTSPPPPGRRR